MSLSTPGTPRTPFVPTKRPVNLRTPKNDFTAPQTPKTPRNNRILTEPETPECFNTVTVETPTETYKNRSSKEKFDEISNLTVAVRIRPLNARELGCVGVSDVVRVKEQELIIRCNAAGNSSVCLDHIFQYDHIFWSCNEESALYSNQEDVFLTIGRPLLNYAFRGYNACLFAYGQTGSGKSFSMMGRNTCEAIDIDSEEYSGITPRFCRDLFQRVAELPDGSNASVEVSYFEIYNEKIHDLLATETSTKTALKVREHPVWGPYVVDLTVHPVKSYKELRNWLLIGNKQRATAATAMNEKSSRSHSIFSIELCLSEGLSNDDNSRRSKVSLVDLAGSERLVHSHNSEEKIRQGVSINKSLLTLGKVISALADQRKNQFVPYRDSVLTWLLRESLGGNSLTSMLATITPASSHIDETLATLRYACQARSIVNRARINENPHDRLIRELRSEVERLRALRQDYERNSMSSCGSTSSLLFINDSHEELEDLRHKLAETENRLLRAQKEWEARFLETKEMQLKELAEAEKRREELESKMRIYDTVDNNLELSPYRTNFLEELEGVLEKENDRNVSNTNNFEIIRNWCNKNLLNCTETANSIVIRDFKRRKQAVVKDNANSLHNFRSVEDFLSSLRWTDFNLDKKLVKADVVSAMNQIYEALSRLQPSDNEEKLSLLFAKVNKSLQSFETALMGNVSKNCCKSVTFNM